MPGVARLIKTFEGGAFLVMIVINLGPQVESMGFELKHKCITLIKSYRHILTKKLPRFQGITSAVVVVGLTVAVVAVAVVEAGAVVVVVAVL